MLCRREKHSTVPVALQMPSALLHIISHTGQSGNGPLSDKQRGVLLMTAFRIVGMSRLGGK